MSGFIAGVTVVLFAFAIALSSDHLFTEDKVPDYTVCAPYVSTPLPDIDYDEQVGIGEDTCWHDEPADSDE